MAEAKAVKKKVEPSEKGPKIVKTLTVQIDEFGMPQFKFDGYWMGKDVALVIRLLRRAYWNHNLRIRRQSDKGGVK